MLDEYKKTANKEYDFGKPFDVEYVPFTHMFYISGTVKQDRTLKTDKNMEKFILIDTKHLEKTLKQIE